MPTTRRFPSRGEHAIRPIFLSLVIVATLLTAPAWGAAAPGAKPAAPADAHAITTGELQQFVKTLQNDQDRTKLIQALQALITAREAMAAKARPRPVPTNFAERLTDRFEDIGTDLVDVAGMIAKAPRLAGWIGTQLRSPETRNAWVEALLELIVIFGLGAVAGFATGRALRPLRARFAERRERDVVRWLARFIATLVLAVVPIAIFAGVATLALAILHPALLVRPAAAVAIRAILEAQALVILMRVILISPATPEFIRLDSETRAYLYVWARRFILWVVYGFAVAEAAGWLGAPDAAKALWLRLLTLILAGLAIAFVLQNREPVARFLRDGKGASAQHPRARLNPFRLLRTTLADSWHLFAIAYIIGSFGSYFVDLKSGLGFVARATAASAIVLVATGVGLRLVRELDRRGFALRADWRQRYPRLEARANKYVPAVVLVLSIIVYAVAILLLLQSWGIDAYGWLVGHDLRHTIGVLASIALVVVISIVIWEVTSAAIERALGNGDTDRQAQVSARLKTLLPLVRSTVLIAIMTIAGFIVLSQLGVDIAPLLAGAGIVGIAVGLGSQALVKDVINGLFVLLENTMTVGEVVDVGSGHSGVVEAITIRTIRLRDLSGSVHTVPFSSVNAVTNLTREFSFYVLDVSVAYDEDTDRVVAALKEIDAEMHADPAFGPLMLEPIQIWGVDRFADSSVVVRARLKTLPIQQWNVGREFNRRMKHAFDQQGISFPFPHRTIDFVNPPPIITSDDPPSS